LSNEAGLPYLTEVEPITYVTMARIIGELRTDVRVPYGVNWALLTLPPFMCSGIFCFYLLARKQTLGRYLLPGAARNYLLAASMAAMWLGGMLLYGMGAHRLGNLGSSIGWAMVMSLMVIVANLWGLLSGEWRGADHRPLRIMAAGMAILVVAMFMVGTGARQAAQRPDFTGVGLSGRMAATWSAGTSRWKPSRLGPTAQLCSDPDRSNALKWRVK
jgi:hypothetical protein